jgi:3-oxoacyl-[acyl-carrier protein] reductase
MRTGLEHLTVLITGASGGIGWALARAFAEQKCRLVLHAGTRLDALRQRVAAESWSDQACCCAADVSDPDQVEQLFAAGREAFGSIDVCVANAGVWPEEGCPLHRLDPARIRRVIDINLLGAIWTARAFLAQVAPREDGKGASLTFIGSTAGRFGEAGHSEYATSKAALVGLLRSLKNEIVRLDPYGRVNLVQPGWTVTEMARPALTRPGLVENVLAGMPLRQLARAEDIARAVVFLSAPELARHVSGEILTVAGGMEGRHLWDPDEIDRDEVLRRLGER